MTLFCVRDGDAAKDDLVWNAPLKKVEKLHDPKPVDRYEKTGTPGVVIDRSTGKMETQIPENDGMSKPLGKSVPLVDPIIQYNGDRLDWLNRIFDAHDWLSHGQTVRFNRWIIKGEVIEGTRIFFQDVPFQIQQQFVHEKPKTRFYKHGVDAYFVDRSDAWFHIKNFPAFRLSFAEPAHAVNFPSIDLEMKPGFLILDDIADRNSDPQDFSSWLNTPEVKKFQKKQEAKQKKIERKYQD